jgi:hypothetical protein
MTYEELLKTKTKVISDAGWDCNATWDFLYPFQAFSVRRALKKARYLIAADCGLGKTRMQLTWAYEVVQKTGKPVLILAPLAVVAQTIDEAGQIGLESFDYFNSVHGASVYIANYEQLDNIDCSIFAGVVLDEASILKNFEGAYRNMIIDTFSHTQYKLCCTATPSPNDPMELGNYSEFLNVMSRVEMLAMYFVHDGGETAKWRIKGHCTDIFWRFISSFTIMFSKPSDIGFSDEGYNLPKLTYIEEVITTTKKNNGQLFNDMAISATNHNAELRETMTARLDKVMQIVQSRPDESFLIWVKQNAEGDELRAKFKSLGITDVVEVKGSDSPEFKKEKLLSFAKGELKYLITKTKIGAMGMNFQNCHNMIFAAPDFSFEQLYQAVRREWRFGQKNDVFVWLITTDTMSNIRTVIETKQKQFTDMQISMQKHMNMNEIEQHTTERKHQVFESANCRAELGDSLQLIDTVKDDSIGFSIWSPPFPELYVYSAEVEDLGNCKGYDEFMQFFSYIPKKIFPKMWAGRNVAIHCMDVPVQKGKEGYIGLRDFSGMIIKQMQDAGFIYHSRVTIWKDPVVEMQRTKALGLLHKQVKKDAAMSRVGIPDYLLVFRKPGEHEHPVKCDIPVDLWQQYASPVWMDIDYGDTLNYRAGRHEQDEKHICPLQLPTINRATHLWSNKGDTCLTMFGGVGSEPYEQILMGRKSIAFELKESYFQQLIKNVTAAEAIAATPKIQFS